MIFINLYLNLYVSYMQYFKFQDSILSLLVLKHIYIGVGEGKFYILYSIPFQW